MNPSRSPLRIDGVEVFVEGEGSDAIVMLHGWPDTHRLWDDQVEFLKKEHRCIRFTLPGFDIAGPRQAKSLDALVDTLKQVVEATCPGEQVTLMLHDWGCFFGYQFAMRHPALVKRIIGVDIGDAGSADHLREIGAKGKFMVFAYQVFLALAWKIGGSFGDRMTRSMARLLRCPSDPALIGSNMCYPYFIRWFGAYGSFRQALPLALSCPMLYIYGGKKPFQFHSSRWAQALRSRPDCEVHDFPTGHWVMKARPREFNQTAGAWLDRLR